LIKRDSKMERLFKRQLVNAWIGYLKQRSKWSNNWYKKGLQLKAFSVLKSFDVIIWMPPPRRWIHKKNLRHLHEVPH
jgi:hypothetical protein